MINIWLLRKGEEKIHLRQAEGGTKTLLDILQENHIFVDAVCAGKGACKGCRVRFHWGAPELTEKERKMLGKEEREAGIRLACVTRPISDCEFVLLSDGQEEMMVLDHGNERIYQGEAAAGQCQNTADCRYGFAVDIGTTTLVAALVDLQNGRQLAVETMVNHQRSYGADVISRIGAANAGKGDLLKESIKRDLSTMLVRLVKRAGVSKSQIEEAVIVGNTTMCHLLRGLSCRGLAASPFTPKDNRLWSGNLGELLGMDDWQTKAEILPGISAFVGADILAGIYAVDMHKREEMSLLLDIGTNGEMVLGSSRGLLVTSAAAGPVFEGGNIACGVPGIPGAVSHITLCGEKKCVKSYQTIGDEPPIGICGSGIIDIMGELVRIGLVDENGTLEDEWFADGFPVAGEEIVFTQKDIRELQLGKSAIRAGIETLLMEGGAQERIRQVFLAGGFGHYMHVEHGIRIGLFPKNFSDKIVPSGNSALEGAKKYLLAGKSEREEVHFIAASAKEINLALHSAFQELYIEHMFF